MMIVRVVGLRECQLANGMVSATVRQSGSHARKRLSMEPELCFIIQQYIPTKSFDWRRGLPWVLKETLSQMKGCCLLPCHQARQYPLEPLFSYEVTWNASSFFLSEQWSVCSALWAVLTNKVPVFAAFRACLSRRHLIKQQLRRLGHKDAAKQHWDF